MALAIHEVENTARVERDHVLAEKEASYQHETVIARERMFAEREMEVARLAAQYNSKNASLDVRIKMQAG
jgi:hypothetical protein